MTEMYVIESERIGLRDQTHDDFAAYCRWRCNADVLKFVLLPNCSTTDEAFYHFANDLVESKKEPRVFFEFAMIEKASGKIIGTAGYVIEKQNKHGGIAEIFYILEPTSWGNGYALEISKAIINYLFTSTNIHKIIANCDARNKASEKVMIKLGMQKEGFSPASRYKNAEWRDNLRYYKLRYMNDMKIREATVSDTKTVTNIIRKSNQTVAEKFGLNSTNCPKHPSNCTDEWISADFEKGVRYFLLESEGNEVGCVALEEKANQELCYLERLAVLPEERNKGFGKNLVNHIFREAKLLGCKRVSIAIIANHFQLKSWYVKLGFKEGISKSFDHLPFDVTFLENDSI